MTRSAMSRCGATRPKRSAARQSGIVLFIALIALVVLTIGAIALMRMLAPAATIAGNMAFKQAATQVSDIGVELAFAYLHDTVAPAGPQNNASSRYYALLRQTDTNGLPMLGSPAMPINWDDGSLPCYDKTGANTSCTDDSTYRIQYVIDRQCTPTTTGGSPFTDRELLTYCLLTPADDTKSSKVSSANAFDIAGPVIYRVTVNVRGPRKTSSLIQASFAF